MDDSAASVRELLDEAAQLCRDLEANRGEARRLIDALAEATESLRRQEEAPPAGAEPRALNAPPGSDGARMLARQMLAGGSDRKAVEQSLRTSFHIEDAEAVVDSVAAAE